MFDIGWSELLVIGIVALVVIGPKELPGALRTLGQWMGKVRRMASEFQNQFHEAMREAELADLKKEVDEMAAKAESYASFDPLDDIRKDIESAASPPPDLESPLTDKPASSTATVADTTSHVTPPAAETPAVTPPAASESAPPAAPATGAPSSETPSTPPATTPDAGRAA
jgi:sec-independent protein translocase protein TatB